MMLHCRYEERWSELNRRHYMEEREALQQQWEELLATRNHTTFTAMGQLHKHYEQEDELAWYLERVEGSVLRFQSQPFQDLKELAQHERDHMRKKEKEGGGGERLVALKEQHKHHKQFLGACEALHELEIVHQRSLAERVEGMLGRVRKDKGKVGVVQKVWKFMFCPSYGSFLSDGLSMCSLLLLRPSPRWVWPGTSRLRLV